MSKTNLLSALDFSQPPALPILEKLVLEYWENDQTFAKSLAKNDQSKDNQYTFYDGPPFATGLPHYGHLLASTTKDLIPRYQTMKGKYVPRVWGWDCHGLPIENLVEKELDLKDKLEIEKYGIAPFNEACRAKVLEYADIWQAQIHRFGRWVDMDHDYKTMDLSYMDGIWGVFKQLWEKDLIYHDYKVMPYCPHCGTPLSNSEVTQGYIDIKDISVYVKFALKLDENCSFTRYLADKRCKSGSHFFGLDLSEINIIAWTTTPWTLPGNLVLAVGADIDYALIEYGESEKKYVIVAEDRADEVMKLALIADYKILDVFAGEMLVGTKYSPIMPYYQDTANAFVIAAADFVEIDSGTGIVHVAPAFGEDDYQVGKKLGLDLVQHVNEEGKFVAEVTDFAGLPVKPRGDHLRTDIEIIKYLALNEILWAKQKIVHSYPHCWRCDTPLLNYATDSWFVVVTKVKEQLLANNEQINWLPEHIKTGRFGKWLEGARDWAISRNRYWGTPLPIWQAEETGEYLCVGSAAELEKLLGGVKVPDLHKHLIDDLVIYHNGLTYRRISQVLDCWFESGSMPYATDRDLPADFISEGQDQTRGWFYTLHVLATIINNGPAFKNCLVSGIILAEDGKKMSKKLKNYPDPEILFEKYGVDAIRLYLMNSPVVGAQTLNFNEKDLAIGRQQVLVVLWNIVAFYLSLSQGSLDFTVENNQLHILDRWLLTRTQELIQQTTVALDKYNLNDYTKSIWDFVQDMSTWYVRLSKDRLRDSNNELSNHGVAIFGQALTTLAKLMAPLTPFYAEMIWQALGNHQQSEANSVHLENWPVMIGQIEADLISAMARFRQFIIPVAHAGRRKAGVKVRQPLASLNFMAPISNKSYIEPFIEELTELILQELNVKKFTIEWTENEVEASAIFDFELTPELLAEGQARELMREIALFRKEKKLSSDQELTYEVSSIPLNWREEIELRVNCKLNVV